MRRFETPCGAATAVASELMDGLQAGSASLRGTALAPALLGALLRGDCLSQLQCARCTTAVANHCSSALAANNAGRSSWSDVAVVRAVVEAGAAMLAADAGVGMGDIDHTFPTQPPPAPPAPKRADEHLRSDDADRGYEAAIAAATQPIARIELRRASSGDNDNEETAAVDGMASAVLALLRALHTTGLDCGLLSQYTMAGLTAAAKSAGRPWSAAAEGMVGEISPSADPCLGWTLAAATGSSAAVPTQAEFLAQVLDADRSKWAQLSSSAPKTTDTPTMPSTTSLAAIADALQEQGRFDLLAVGALSGLPTDPSGLCAIAAALNTAGIGAGRVTRLSTLQALCCTELAAAMVTTVPEYGSTVSDLVTRLRPHKHEVNIWIWDVLIAAEKAAAAAESKPDLSAASRLNLRELTQCCVLNYQSCTWEQQAALRDSYYAAIGSGAVVRVDGDSRAGDDASSVLLFGASGLDAAAAASLRRTTEASLVASFNKLTNASDDGQSKALWAQVGRLALVSPTLLLSKVTATVAKQAGAETAESLAALVLRLGRIFCHYSSTGSGPTCTLFTSCVSSQLKSSAHEPREVSNLIEFVGRLATEEEKEEPGEEEGTVKFSELVRVFVVPHLAMDSEHLPAALRLLKVALGSRAAALQVCDYAPDALGCVLCSLLAGGGRENLAAAVLQDTVDALGLLLDATQGCEELLEAERQLPALNEEEDGDRCKALSPKSQERQQVLASTRSGLEQHAAQLHWTVALSLCRVCNTAAADRRRVVLAWAAGRSPLLCGGAGLNDDRIKATDESEAEVVMQALSDLLFSCALADAVLQPSLELLTRLRATENHTATETAEPFEMERTESLPVGAAVKLVQWAASRPLELYQMTVSCVARMLPRLAQTEARRLLCTALPKLYVTSALPQPPADSWVVPQPTASGEPAAAAAADDDDDAAQATTPQLAEVSNETAARLCALQIGALAAVLWLGTACPGASLLQSTPSTDGNADTAAAAIVSAQQYRARVGGFLRAWPYSSTPMGGLRQSMGLDDDGGASSADGLAHLALGATRHSIACVQHACGAPAKKSGTDGADDEKGEVGKEEAELPRLFALVCGLLSCSARVRDAYSSDLAMQSSSVCIGVGGCAKATHVLAMNLLQSRRASSLGAARGEWAAALREMPQPHRGQLRKLLGGAV
eukprot:COSAG06_NODE_1596_length_8978_cov_15.305215_6_plen_1178_part_00